MNLNNNTFSRIWFLIFLVLLNQPDVLKVVIQLM
jgi:hypothetical protein